MSQRQSFAAWRLPKELDGLLMLEDRRDGSGWMPHQQLHRHDEVELHFFERGRGTLRFSDGVVPAEAGTLVWIPAGRDHVLKGPTADLVRWMLLCRRRTVQRVLPRDASRELLGRAGRELTGRVSRPAIASLRQTCRDVLADRARDLSVVNAGVAFLLARAWLHHQSATTRPEPSAMHPAVATAVRLLREPGERPSMPDLARAAHVTEAHLSKLFVAQVGVTITEFRNRVGVERFLEIYDDGGGPTLLEAALDAGFGSYPQFYRVFTKHMGYPPAEHRARARVSRDAGGS